MASVSIYEPNKSMHLGLGDFQLLQLSRPTHKARFTCRGREDVHLLVFLDDDQEVPFIRVPLHVLLRAAKLYERNN
ncbi:hypothetical protein L9W76_03170 [Vibrio aestuarianus]|uniref:hypothetical protein n=1 Tax=Vibrio aestuarianus TaxID=28171 RepID=UPI00237D1908|nr:hypothetical protein [Vibrio aestuarianus]MDE1226173.1 hypothetical protein [Vibrio aestuarianus]MDE1226178.1 hypothetical protein [Vibrio aestuarianus]MDE1252187.1 hypothetical protein [Vibrio aestuarianus]MDH5901724.1 hypothetical protein [Vibrio aestuarianus]MDH5956818.1 hypothetical protein [Vibrio aestuarianus]